MISPDESDLALATRELARGRDELTAALRLVDRRQRAEAIKAAISRLALASRAIDDVVARREG